jgi:hypothetical protein
VKYVRNAFDPIGVMLDYWGQDLPAGQETQFKAIVINDLYEDLSGALEFRLMKGKKVVARRDVPCAVGALGKVDVACALPVPSEPGDYTLVAEFTDKAGRSNRSTRDAKVVAAQ